MMRLSGSGHCATRTSSTGPIIYTWWKEASSGWRDWILFRDYLRSHPVEAGRYSALKERLAAADRKDRAHYRVGKAPLIAELMEQARAWNDGDDEQLQPSEPV